MGQIATFIVKMLLKAQDLSFQKVGLKCYLCIVVIKLCDTISLLSVDVLSFARKKSAIKD